MSKHTKPLFGFFGRLQRLGELALLLCLGLMTFQSSAQVLVPLTDVTRIAAGFFHTCALTSGGGVKCWGGGGWLGHGTFSSSPTPVDVSGLTSGVSTIAASTHTCAVTAGGGVKCWGLNNRGQIGDGTTSWRLTPVDVSGLASGVSAIAVGEGHTCALTSGGGVKCWGGNGSGQLGDGTTTQSLTPVDVSGLGSGVRAISLGANHSCALTTGGGVKCWGNNFNGELGDGTTLARLAPVDVSGLTSGVSAISLGANHSCALTTGGGVKCWGENLARQLGNGTNFDAWTAGDVIGLTSGAIAISGGLEHSCAVTSGGGVKCWGGNSEGQLGNGTTTFQLSLVDVSGASGISAIAAGSRHTCALTSGGRIECWGSNFDGQLGDGTTTNRRMPFDVIGLTSGIDAVAAGGFHTCVLAAGGGVKCWGLNSSGQLGDATTTNRLTAVDVSGLGSGVSAIAVGYIHTCALTTGGGVKCWGNNFYGQLGDGTTTDRLTPFDVSGLTTGVSAIAAGSSHTCALTTGGGVKCWGDNSIGQLGDGTQSQRPTPVDVNGLGSGVDAISGSLEHTCALTTSGGVKCWGRNTNGQLGDGTTTNRLTAVDVSGLGSGVSAIAVGYFHTCALTTGGGVKCWGGNSIGQLGDGTQTLRPTPVDVSGLTSGVSAIAVGYSHTCALITGGGAKCWGGNGSGQLGDGTQTQRPTPVDVSGLGSGVRAISLGDYHTCALTTAGGAKCWGRNFEGQLGVSARNYALPGYVLINDLNLVFANGFENAP
jgi:alpha-tubulin suppressor-like RCC1 family protein